MNIIKLRKNYWRDRAKDSVSAGGGWIRRKMLGPSWARLMFPPDVGEDPLKEWKDWGNRVTKLFKHRLPGNWHTARGIKKRKRILLRYFA